MGQGSTSGNHRTARPKSRAKRIVWIDSPATGTQARLAWRKDTSHTSAHTR